MTAQDLFGQAALQRWTRYRAQITFTNLVVGGIPSDRSVIASWLRSRLDIGDQALQELIDQTVAERGILTPDEAVIAVLDSDLAPSINGFKRNPDTGELSLEGRQVKAALKEWANSAYPGTNWPGKTKAGVRKGAMRHLAECVFVEDDLIGLGVKEPTRVEERVKHIQTPQGPRSAINQVEVIHQPTCEFTLRVRDEALWADMWPTIWSTGEQIGLGADRGRSDGKFELDAWEII
jgi:hypothetical protein